MTREAHAKINWTLDVLGTRPDGYHELDMLMQTVSLCDLLTFEPDGDLTLNGEAAPDNLVIRAAELLRQETGCRLGARVSLEKRIPAMAGLGGGSADCAQTLLALNELWALGLSRERLLSFGARLGADVPFCLVGGFARVRGLGERVEPLPAPQKNHLLIAMPREGLSTKRVFERFDATSGAHVDTNGALRALWNKDWPAFVRCGGNALERAAASLRPEIPALIASLRSLGADAAFMTGSGAAVVGAFSDRTPAMAAQSALACRCALCALCVPT